MGFLTGIIYILVSFFVGSIFIGLALNLITLHLAVIYINKYILADGYSRLIVGISGGLIILFIFRYLQSLFRNAKQNRSITFESPEGTVDITLFAIEDMIRRMLEGRKEIVRIRPKIISRKKQMEVFIRGDLAVQVNILEFTREIQASIKEKLEAVLGEEKDIKVRIKIRKMIFAGGKKEEEEPEVPFRKY